MPCSSPHAYVTGDTAAPMECTVASLARLVSLLFEAPATTHEVAAIHADRGGVTLASCSPFKAYGWVRLTECWRVFKVD